MNIIVLGPQGSGKGTQAELLSKHLQLPTLSIGELYREEVEKKSAIGKKVSGYILKGKLAPLQITENLLKKELKKGKYKKGLILDGFPRNNKQAQFLNNIIKVDWVLLIDIDTKETMRRLGGRYVCDCGQTYNLFSTKAEKPKRNLKCDKCQKKLYQRADDKPKAIKQRLKIYRKDTLPLLKYYKKQGKLISIDGQKPIKNVFKSIITVLAKKTKAI